MLPGLGLQLVDHVDCQVEHSQLGLGRVALVLGRGGFSSVHTPPSSFRPRLRSLLRWPVLLLSIWFPFSRWVFFLLILLGGDDLEVFSLMAATRDMCEEREGGTVKGGRCIDALITTQKTRTHFDGLFWKKIYLTVRGVHKKLDIFHLFS